MVAIHASDKTYQKLQTLSEKLGQSIEDVILEALNTPSQAELAAIEQHIHSVLRNPKSETRQKLYALSRKYWLEHQDYERLTLSDAELDEQFWLIDNGIPRFKSEQGKVEIDPDPLEAFVGLFAESTVTDASVRVNETVETYYQDKYGNSD